MNINTNNIKSLQKTLDKAYNKPRGIFDSYLSCLGEQDISFLNDLHEKTGTCLSKKKFADKIRKGKYEIKTVISLEIL